MPCEFCPRDGDESDCWNCSRAEHDPEPGVPADGHTAASAGGYYERKAAARQPVGDFTGAACFVLFILLLLGWGAGRLLGVW